MLESSGEIGMKAMLFRIFTAEDLFFHERVGVTHRWDGTGRRIKG